MNGRVYDYNLGRFLSVDPFVHEGTQGINPYSYIMNNPLSGTDPTGYSPEDLELKKVEFAKKTERVSVTGSHIKRKVTTGVSGTATYSNGSTQSFSATFSGGKVATMDIGSIKHTNTSTQTHQVGNSIGEAVKGVAQEGAKSLKKGGFIGAALAPSSLATDEQVQESIALPDAEPIEGMVQEMRRPTHKQMEKTLLAAGFKKPGNGYSPHHIVPIFGFKNLENGIITEGMREILKTNGININSAENLIWLPNYEWARVPGDTSVLHGVGHRHRTLRQVNQMLNIGSAAAGERGVRAALSKVKADFRAGIIY